MSPEFLSQHLQYEKHSLNNMDLNSLLNCSKWNFQPICVCGGGLGANSEKQYFNPNSPCHSLIHSIFFIQHTGHKLQLRDQHHSIDIDTTVTYHHLCIGASSLNMGNCCGQSHLNRDPSWGRGKEKLKSKYNIMYNRIITIKIYL